MLLGKAHDAPTFPSHMTLVGDIRGNREDIISRTREVASALDPVPICLSVIDTSLAFFQSVFIRVDKTPQVRKSMLSCLIRASRLCTSIFGY